MIEESEVIKQIGQLAAASSQKAVAKELKVHPQVICDVLQGRRNISQRLASALGYRRVFGFVPKKPRNRKIEEGK